MTKEAQIIKNGLYGHIVGDALGVPYEFIPREFRETDPCITMVGHGSHNKPKGSWSDDTSLTIAGLDGLTASLQNVNPYEVEKVSEVVDYEEIMMNFARWYALSDYTPFGYTWGVGFATQDAILRFLKGNEPLECGGIGERDNGNGSIMRMLPICYLIYFLSKEYEITEDEKMEIIHNFASLTHRHKRSQMACGIYCLIALEIIDHCYNETLDYGLESMVRDGLNKAMDYYYSTDEWDEEIPHFKWVFSGNVHHLSKDKIKSGGYVISTLEASIWCLLNNGNYHDTVLDAVNLGYDTDTTACTVGALAGLYYGVEDIPKDWLDSLVFKDYLDSLIDVFCDELFQFKP